MNNAKPEISVMKTEKKGPALRFEAKNIPIYIISFNRVSYLKEIISALEKFRLTNIHIIDNASTYPPLLEYLKESPYIVHYMKENLGHMVFFKADEFKDVRENEYYVLTDPDVIPVDECLPDFMDFFYDLLQRYPQYNKVGFSLKTDDIGQTVEEREVLQKWENQFYKKRINRFKPYLYDSYIDTTFALYRPQKEWKTPNFYYAIRTGFPYQAKHLPWYKNFCIPDEEDEFYASTDCGSGNWKDGSNIERIKDALASKCADHWWEYIFSVKESRGRKIIRVCGLKITKK